MLNNGRALLIREGGDTMTKASAKVLLIVFGNFLMYVVPLAVGLIPGLFSIALPFILVFLAAHVTGSVFSCRRFKCKFGISPGKYVMYGTMPAFVLNVISLMIWFVFMAAAVKIFGDLAYAFFSLSLVCAGYSVFYLIILTVVVSRFE